MHIDSRKFPVIIFIILLLVAFVCIAIVRLRTADTQQLTTSTMPTNCSNGNPQDELLEMSSEPILRKLHEYEVVCSGAVTDTSMLFTAMPTTDEEAKSFVRTLTPQLKEFAKHNIQPLISFEPNLTNPTVIQDIHAGTYDSILRSYFENLKATGLTSKQIGTWILFPEANTPAWHNTDPAIFASNVTKVGTIQEQVFTDSRRTILLNNTTYNGDDQDWSDGVKKDLRPYVSTIPKDLLESFGYQAFPYVSPKNEKTPYGQLNAADFMKLDDARSAARALGTKNVWINTGTFRDAHTQSVEEKVSLSLDQRQSTLESITKQILALQDSGFNASVNFFTEDKSDTSEHINWSYWARGKYDSSPDTDMFKEALGALQDRNIPISLYDTH